MKWLIILIMLGSYLLQPNALLAQDTVVLKHIGQLGFRTTVQRCDEQHRCTTVEVQAFELEDYKKLVELDLLTQKLEAQVAAKDDIIAMQAAALQSMQNASQVEDARYKDILENRDAINLAYMNELSRPKLPYPEWFEPVRITIEVILAGCVAGLGVTTYVLTR